MAASHGLPIEGRCYCGATTLTIKSRPLTVVYCHCPDCRRSTGAPVAAYAAFRVSDVRVTSGRVAVASPNPGARRTFCADCGSPILARYDYLPDQVYVPVGILDQAEYLVPERHAHADQALEWLHISDDLPRHSASSRDALNAATKGTA